jgi:hypothetical protein
MEFREIISRPMVGKVEVGDSTVTPQEVGGGDRVSGAFPAAPFKRRDSAFKIITDGIAPAENRLRPVLPYPAWPLV